MLNFTPAKGYEEYFLINTSGEVFSLKTNKVLKFFIHKNGYKVFSTRLSGRKSKAVCIKIHRLVALTFIDNPLSKPMVNHIDGNKLNNDVSNLEWVTSKENYHHAIATGLSDYSNLKALGILTRKLNPEQILYIKESYTPRHKDFGARALSRKFNIAHTTILSIINNTSYRD